MERGARADGESRAAGEGEERARLFVALELPEEVRDRLGRWLLGAMADLGAMRPVAPGHQHVTLCFLGWQPAAEIQAIADACRGLSPGDLPALSVGDPLWLPPRRSRVLAVRLDDARGRLTAIQAELSALLQAGGWYQPERRPYLPHVTVARAGRKGTKPTPLPAPPALSITGRRLTLFRSRLSRAGARYEPLASVNLG